MCGIENVTLVAGADGAPVGDGTGTLVLATDGNLREDDLTTDEIASVDDSWLPIDIAITEDEPQLLLEKCQLIVIDITEWKEWPDGKLGVTWIDGFICVLVGPAKADLMDPATEGVISGGIVGRPDGWALVWALGWAVGFVLLASEVAFELGCGVGILEGLKLGLALGLELGLALGLALGFVVGDDGAIPANRSNHTKIHNQVLL
jgi:hypothetical protein